jgi:hypothetical protein
MSNQNLKNDQEFEKMMEDRIRENFSSQQTSNNTFSDERLIELNKKLPSWSLEPPYSFLK